MLPLTRDQDMVVGSKSFPSSAFFVRKGAGCLSRWVGEAERQFRLPFEEALYYLFRRNSDSRAPCFNAPYLDGWLMASGRDRCN